MSVAEIAFLFIQPSNALFLLLALGAVAAVFSARIGAWIMGAGVVLIGVCGLSPLGPMLMASLEERYPFVGIVEPPDGIIILGGFVSTTTSLDHNQIQMNDMAERITAGAALARRFPDAAVIVSDGVPAGETKSGAELSKVMLVDFGVDLGRIVREERAASTWDNARFTYDLVAPQRGQRWVLVTSAFHMPRAVATFAAAGWTGLVPWPVDYAAGRPAWKEFPGSVSLGLRMVDWAVREYGATLYYALSGRLSDPATATAASLIGPRAVRASTSAPRWVTRRRPAADNRAAASRTAGINARHSASLRASWRATSDGHTVRGARAAVSARMVHSSGSAAIGGRLTRGAVGCERVRFGVHGKENLTRGQRRDELPHYHRQQELFQLVHAALACSRQFRA